MPRGGWRGGGRPKLGENKKQSVNIRVTPDDLAWAKQSAQESGLSLSALFALALACLRKHQEELPK